jgi:hypothetical protein
MGIFAPALTLRNPCRIAAIRHNGIDAPSLPIPTRGAQRNRHRARRPVGITAVGIRRPYQVSGRTKDLRPLTVTRGKRRVLQIAGKRQAGAVGQYVVGRIYAKYDTGCGLRTDTPYRVPGLSEPH